MLVLSRKSQQALRVGDEVVIHVLEINNKQVKLGIEAPRDVSVMRVEDPRYVSAIGSDVDGADEEVEKTG
ncbi:MAG: carbon storage regulator [Litorivicinus sp.]